MLEMGLTEDIMQERKTFRDLIKNSRVFGTRKERK